VTALRRVAARHLWTPDAGLTGARALVLDADHTLVDIAEVTPQDDVLDGILMPGWVNCHAHLELSHHRKPVGRRGLGSPGWVGALFAANVPPRPDAALLAARRARASGTAFLIDVSNSGDTAEAMSAARLRGTVQHELIGTTEARWSPGLSNPPTGKPEVPVRPTAHAPISCAPELLRQALSHPGPPPTIHCDEDSADAELLAHRQGPWTAFHEAIARRADHPWRTALGTASSGVALLDQLALLSHVDIGLVHLTHAGPEDLDRLAHSRATAVLCPRSNQHITGRLPDLPGMIARGIPIALGTDSLASTPDLDLLAEAAVLHAAFPQVDPTVLVRALCNGGLLPHHPSAGELAVGQRPDVLLVELPEDAHPLHRLLDGTRWPRRWLT